MAQTFFLTLDTDVQGKDVSVGSVPQNTLDFSQKFLEHTNTVHEKLTRKAWTFTMALA